MTDPKRWLDEGGGASASERELLDFAQKVQMPEAMRARVWAGIAAGATGVGATGAAEAAGTMAVRKGIVSLVTGSTIGKGVVAVALAGGLGFGAMVMRTPSRQATSAPPSATLPSAVESSPAPRSLNPMAGDEELLAHERPLVLEPPETAVGRSTAPTPPVRPARAAAPHEASTGAGKDKSSNDVAPPPQETREAASASRLREETAAVLAIRKTLLAGRAGEALNMLDRAAKEFANGVLVEEREALAVRALVGTGQRDLADQRGAAFLRAFPRSPHASDVRALLGR